MPQRLDIHRGIKYAITYFGGVTLAATITHHRAHLSDTT
jgi:hypothetical protein